MKIICFLAWVLAASAAPLMGQAPRESPTSPGAGPRLSPPIWTGAHRHPVEWIGDTPADTAAVGEVPSASMAPYRSLPLNRERGGRDRWCGAGWGAGLGALAGSMFAGASTLWTDSLAPLVIGIVMTPFAAMTGAVIGALIGCPR